MAPADPRVALAREKLGRFVALCAFKELRALPEVLEAGEQLVTAAYAIDGRRRQRIVLVTDRALVVLSQGFVTNRRHVARFALADLGDVAPSGTGWTVRASGTDLVLRFLYPAARQAELLDAVRAASGRGAPALGTAELLELARTKLGRIGRYGNEAELFALGSALEAGESVVTLVRARLASAAAGDELRDVLLALTDRALVIVGVRALRAGDVERVPLAEVAEPDLLEDASGPLILRWRQGEERRELLGSVPAERLAELAVRLGASRSAPPA